jgi:hypothetical protein
MQVERSENEKTMLRRMRDIGIDFSSLTCRKGERHRSTHQGSAISIRYVEVCAAFDIMLLFSTFRRQNEQLEAEKDQYKAELMVCSLFQLLILLKFRC